MWDGLSDIRNVRGYAKTHAIVTTVPSIGSLGCYFGFRHVKPPVIWSFGLIKGRLRRLGHDRSQNKLRTFGATSPDCAASSWSLIPNEARGMKLSHLVLTTLLINA